MDEEISVLFLCAAMTIWVSESNSVLELGNLCLSEAFTL